MDNLPQVPRKDRRMAPIEPIQVDEIWATPSTLHMRVTIWGKGWAWRRKHQVAVPLDDIPREALLALYRSVVLGIAAEEERDQEGLW